MPLKNIFYNLKKYKIIIYNQDTMSYIFLIIITTGILFLSIKRSFCYFNFRWYYKAKRLQLHYEMIENIHLQNEDKLKEDLFKRLGIEVLAYKIHEVDFLKDMANITLIYRPMSKSRQLQEVQKRKIPFTYSSNPCNTYLR